MHQVQAGSKITIKTDPNNKDSDGDGIEDGVEVEQGRNPLVNEAVIILIINSAEE